jgi:O-acetyl-ADP-ribose deacetylase (regulator of RNase III)
MLSYQKGDLLASKCKIIGHGCNAYGIMGGGIALSIRKKWPVVFSEYHEKYLIESVTSGGHLELGSVIPVDVTDNLKVLNMITQKSCGGGQRYVDYEAVAKCFEWVEKQKYNTTIGIPMIGAGLAGGDWDIIETIIKKTCNNTDVVVYQL